MRNDRGNDRGSNDGGNILIEDMKDRIMSEGGMIEGMIVG